MKGNNTKGKTFFSWNTFNIELERFFSEFRNIFNFMSRNKHLFSVETISIPQLNLEIGYLIKLKCFPYYQVIISDKIEENSSFIKKINRLFIVYNNEKSTLFFQLKYTIYDNTCENNIFVEFDSNIYPNLYNEKQQIKLYKDFINFTKQPFFNYFNELSINKKTKIINFILESIIINTSFYKLFNYLKNIENIVKIHYLHFKWIFKNEKEIEIYNQDTKNTILFSINGIKKINEECYDFEIQKSIKKKDNIGISYITHIIINPISKNLCWLCLNYPTPYEICKSEIQNISSFCKFFVKKIKLILENLSKNI